MSQLELLFGGGIGSVEVLDGKDATLQSGVGLQRGFVLSLTRLLSSTLGCRRTCDFGRSTLWTFVVIGMGTARAAA